MNIVVPRRRIVPVQQLEALATRAIKERTKLRYFAPGEVRALGMKAEQQRDGEPVDSYGLIARINSAEVDRHDTVVLPEGIDAAAFVKNPVVLWEHGQSARGNLPVASVTELQQSEDAIDAHMTFDGQDDFAVELLKKYRRGFLRGFSVGFIPHAHEVRKIGFAGEEKRDTLVFTDWELVELSCVAVPSNPEALAA